MEKAKTKRSAGQLAKDGRWHVLVESTGEEGVGYTHKCGTKIMGKDVAFSIHDGPFPLSGFGQVVNEKVPYCPNCEQEPSPWGVIGPT